MNFIKKLDYLLKNKGISSGQMLSELKMGKNQYAYWKKNNIYPNNTTLNKICDYFKISIDYFYDEKNLSTENDGQTSLKQQLISTISNSNLSDDELSELLHHADILKNKHE